VVEVEVEVGVMVLVAEAVNSTGTAQPARRAFLGFIHTSFLIRDSDSDKKVHQGWGGDEGNTELKAEQAATTDAKNEWTTDTAAAGEWGAAPAGDAAAADAWGAAPAQGAEGEKAEGRGRKFVEEEEDHTLTLDQYLAQKKEKDAAIPKIEAVRVANDGAEDAFKGATLIAKSEEEETYFAGKVRFNSNDAFLSLTLVDRPRVHPSLAPRRRRRFSWRSRAALNATSVLAVAVDAEVIAAVAATEEVAEAARPLPTQPSTLTMRLLSRACLELSH